MRHLDQFLDPQRAHTVAAKLCDGQGSLVALAAKKDDL
jgi:hypothetical protein